jgi:hypothetical protein
MRPTSALDQEIGIHHLELTEDHAVSTLCAGSALAIALGVIASLSALFL